MEYLKSSKGSDIVEVAGLFKAYDFHLVESLDTPLVEMSVCAVNI